MDEVATALEMRCDETAQLFLLSADAQPFPPFPEGPVQHGWRDAIAWHPHPAALFDPAGTYLAWNRHYTRWLHNPRNRPANQRNIMLWLFSPTAERVFADIDAMRADAVARLRWIYSIYTDDPRLQQAVATVRRHPQGRRLWNAHAVSSTTLLRHSLRHPTTGDIHEMIMTVTPASTGEFLLLFIPAPRTEPTTNTSAASD